MLSLLFTTLQSSFSSLFAKPFILGSFLPVVLFLSTCAFMANQVGGAPQAWVIALNPAAAAGATPWNVTGSFAVVIGFSYCLSGLNGFLLELWEGKHLGFLTGWLHRAELARYLRIDRELARCQDELDDFDAPPAVGAAPNVWMDLIGQMAQASNAAGPAIPLPAQTPPSLDIVMRKREAGDLLTLAELTTAVNTLLPHLSAGAGASPLVGELHETLIDAIQYARERLMLEKYRLHYLRQFQFPVALNASRGTSSLNVIAPTRIGNITRTIRTYALDRYNLDLNIFWTRLQGAMVKEKEAVAGLQDAKTQVDFMVSAFWLTWLFIVLWSVILIWFAPRPGVFLAVVIGGPIATRLMYLAGCQNYIVFADLTRSSIDLFRNELIDQLRLAKPPGNNEEQAMWRRLGGWLGYANESDINFKP
jgi:hypothetical protein